MSCVIPSIQRIIDKLQNIVKEYGRCNCNNPLSNCNSVNMRLKEKDPDKYAVPNDGEWTIPDMDVDCHLDAEGRVDDIIIRFEVSYQRYSPYSTDSLASDWIASDFSKEHEDSIRYRQIYGDRYQVTVRVNNLKEDVAVIISEIVSVFGASVTTEFHAKWFFNYTRGDLSLAKFTDGLKPSMAIHNALDKCLSLAKEHSDNPMFNLILYIDAEGEDSKGTMLFVHSEGINMDYLISQEELDHHRSYVNYDCLNLFHCGDYLMNSTGFGVDNHNLDLIEKFLTDYILFLNPGAAVDDIVATIDFPFNIDYEKVPDELLAYQLEYSGNGTCPIEEQLNNAVDFYLNTLD